MLSGACSFFFSFFDRLEEVRVRGEAEVEEVEGERPKAFFIFSRKGIVEVRVEGVVDRWSAGVP